MSIDGALALGLMQPTVEVQSPSARRRNNRI
jgi:hypothetical protein